MTRKILINATEEEESRVAVLQGGGLQEFYIERLSMGTCLGNVYKGRISNIEPSIGAAFVEIGGPRNGFLHVSDVNAALVGNSQGARKKKKRASACTAGEAAGGKKKAQGTKVTDQHGVPRIDSVLRVGQELLVQVSKDGIGNKGPTLTTFISLPGRFLVFMPGVSKKGISRKIDDEAERERLKGLLSELIPDDKTGVIVRTAGIHQLKKDLQRDFRYLTNIWNGIKKRECALDAPAELFKENDLVIRVLRDVFCAEVSRVLVDSKDVYKRACEFMKGFLPRHVDKVRLYRGSTPLFDRYKLEKELKSVLQPRLALKSGGSLFIEQTEALVAIDVNSGSYKGEELEETAFAINMEASSEIGRQLRLRDLGGLIIIDFIDMQNADHKRAVEKEFREALKVDRARIKVARISPFGVIEVTRQRLRPSLERSVYEKCPHCKGTGFVATSETLSLNLIRKIRLWVMQDDDPVLRIRINDRVAEYIQNSKRRLIHGLEENAGKRIIIVGDPLLPQEEIYLDKGDPSGGGQGMLF
jgi:ribonuclease E